MSGIRPVAALFAVAACGAPTATRPAIAPPPRRPRAELTPQLVLDRVRGGYAHGVQRCYSRYLKNHGGHGRVIVSFTVNAKGQATDGAASGVPARLGDCIVAEVARWRFPAPRRGEQSFALPLDLIAD